LARVTNTVIVSIAGTVTAESSHPDMLLPKTSADNTSKNRQDESFFDMLMRCQVSIFIVQILLFSAINTLFCCIFIMYIYHGLG